MLYQQKVQKQEFCDSVCYKIPYHQFHILM